MQDIDTIIYSEPRKTFMEIMKVHKSEVPFANLLGFFFRPKENHRLGTHFLEALLRTPCYKISDVDVSSLLISLHPEVKTEVDSLEQEDIEVELEYRTAEDNRIDILIDAPEFVICIEFKINHDLNNPLQDYVNFVRKTYPNKKHYFVILTPYKKAPIGAAAEYFRNNNEFRQIILNDFFAEVNENLPKEFSEDKEKEVYFNYYQELQQTVLNRKIRSQRHKVLKILKSQLNKEYSCAFHNNISGGFLEIKLNDYRLKVRIKPTGWHFEKWSLNNTFQEKIEKLNPDTTLPEVIQTLRNVLKSEAVIHSMD